MTNKIKKTNVKLSITFSISSKLLRILDKMIAKDETSRSIFIRKLIINKYKRNKTEIKTC